MKQAQDNRTTDLEDIFTWSNGTWCYRYEVDFFPPLSDDFTVLYVGTNEREEFLSKYYP